MKEASAALVWPALSFIFAGVFFSLWRLDPSRRHLLGYACAFLALSFAMSFHIALPSLNTALAVAVSHGVVCLSIAAIAWSSCSRLAQRVPVELMIAISVVSCALIFVALETGKEEVALAVQNGASGVLFGVGAITLWLARPTDILDRILVFTMGAFATIGLTRPAIMILLDVDVERMVNRQSDFSTVSLIIMTVLTVVLGLTLVAIALRETIEIRTGSQGSDAISGFLDQTTFGRSSEVLLAKARELKMPACLAIIQLDWFNAVSVKWGEHSSDAIIRQIADVIRTWQRESDLIGRVGEDRIGILLIGTSEKSALKSIDELRAAIDASCNDGFGRSMKFTVSISILVSKAGRDFARLFVLASKPLDGARALGGNVTFVEGEEHQPCSLIAPGTASIDAHQ